MSLRGSRTLQIAPGLVAHADGALWLPGDRALVVAGVHLDAVFQVRLNHLLDELTPIFLLIIGGLKHTPRASLTERGSSEQALAHWRRRCEVILVRSKNDHHHSDCVDVWRGKQAVVVDAHRPSGLDTVQPLLLGRWHPTVSISDMTGAAQKLRTFLVWPEACLLPSFSVAASGFDVSRGLPAEMAPFVESERAVAVATTGREVVTLGPIQTRIRKPRQAAAAAAGADRH